MKRSISRWLMFLAILGTVCLIVAPLERNESHSYGGEMKAPWAGGEIQVYLQPAFRTVPSAWPPLVCRGNPYTISVMWVSSDEKAQFAVNRVLIEGDGQRKILLPRTSAMNSSKHGDGRYSYLVTYDQVSLSSPTLKIARDCIVSRLPGSNQKTMVFTARRVDKRWFSHKILSGLLSG